MFRKSLSVLIVVVLLAAGAVSFAQGDRATITTDNVLSLDMEIRLGRGSAEAIAYTPDGKTILVGGTLGIWKYSATSLDTQQEPELLDFNDGVEAFTLMPDGTTLAVLLSNADGIAFYDLATGDSISVYEPEASYQYQLTASTDGNLLAISNGSGGLEVYDMAAQTALTTADTSLDTDVPILFTEDGTQIIAAGSNYDVYMWDLEAGGEPVTLDGHTSGVEAMAISPDGSLLVTGSTDDTIIVWSMADGSLVETIDLSEEDYSTRDTFAVAFTPDGSGIITGHGGLMRVWDAESLTVSSEISIVGEGQVRDIVFSPDGSQFIIRSSEATNAVQLYNADGSFVASTNYHNSELEALAFSPDSAVLAINDDDGYLYMWDTASAQELTFATRIAESATFGTLNRSNITFSSDNNYLGVIQSFGVAIVDPVDGSIIHNLSDMDGITEDLEFSPDNTLLAVITSRGLYIFDVATGRRLLYVDDAHDWMQDVTWSPDQTMLATASSDYAVRIYSVPAQ